MLDQSSEPEFPANEKTLPPSQITSQQQLMPVQEIVWDDLAIREALKHLWEKAER
jgi:hypothetical protein